ncbi:LodA/GoxA family CTQ-dependent oxidase [Providencia stuartii]|uniref:LodA/GoxA family CTQ-dependent oxidase n=1 Tax=Providencia stuartii TaxID=588 RepID=UPI00069EACB7|nr:LodA/GoxA family CTQ-dependent oxidase [Providencia stuartii]
MNINSELPTPVIINKDSNNPEFIEIMIPANAGLRMYDLLTIHWESNNILANSYPQAITSAREGKEFLYNIPISKVSAVEKVKIWYSFCRVGFTDIQTSPEIFVNISSLSQVDKTINHTGSLAQTKNINLDEIVYAKIHPGIGIGRVGNSKNEYYVGPEYAGQPSPPFGSTRDASGAIKRQAAKFRVYGYNKNGVAIAELTTENADITWHVELANTKASWYDFDNAMDQPASIAKAVARRNPLIKGIERRELEIRPPVKTINGANRSGIQFDGGKFKNVPVNLGELLTDSVGRLLVLGGHGKSASPSGAPLLVIDADGNEHNFNNSVDWYDDTSDGPVSAEVTIKGRRVPTTDAWVVIGPPDYAPGIVPFRSMTDMITHTAIESGTLPPVTETSYTRDILPLLTNLANLQWVNLGFAQVFGPGGSFPIDANLIKELPLKESTLKRFDVFSQFRAPDDITLNGGDKMKWPQLYGDGFETLPLDRVGDLLPVSPVSYQHLVNFVTSNFINDLEYNDEFTNTLFPTIRYTQPVDELPIEMQPDVLDKGPLSYCCADAFHPGCELTWPMRHESLYSEFLRIKRRKINEHEKNYGDILTPEQALAADGPLHKQGPGDLTRWMAVPWQGDTARCRSGYDKEFHPYLPSFWPAKVPNEVLSEYNYNLFNNNKLSEHERTEAFQTRHYWQRGFFIGNHDNESVMQATVSHFDLLGIVQRLPAPDDYEPSMDSVFVEQLKPGSPSFPEVVAAFSAHINGVPIKNRTELLKQLGWTEKQWEEFRRTR